MSRVPSVVRWFTEAVVLALLATLAHLLGAWLPPHHGMVDAVAGGVVFVIGFVQLMRGCESARQLVLKGVGVLALANALFGFFMAESFAVDQRLAASLSIVNDAVFQGLAAMFVLGFMVVIKRRQARSG